MKWQQNPTKFNHLQNGSPLQGDRGKNKHQKWQQNTTKMTWKYALESQRRTTTWKLGKTSYTL